MKPIPKLNKLNIVNIVFAIIPSLIMLGFIEHKIFLELWTLEPFLAITSYLAFIVGSVGLIIVFYDFSQTTDLDWVKLTLAVIGLTFKVILFFSLTKGGDPIIDTAGYFGIVFGLTGLIASLYESEGQACLVRLKSGFIMVGIIVAMLLAIESYGNIIWLFTAILLHIAIGVLLIVRNFGWEIYLICTIDRY